MLVSRVEYDALEEPPICFVPCQRPLLDDVLRDPRAGLGNPQQLRHALACTWPRRITDEHRVDAEDVVVLQARYHH
jgi:Txe/YoeB family toxin of Txe-Axe toxin-antitoxin module